MAKEIVRPSQSIHDGTNIDSEGENMKKMNYSNFEDNVEIISSSSVDILDTQRNENMATSKMQSTGGSIANAINPVVAVASVVNTIISDISKCIAIVSIEKQRTKQVKAQARIQIEESIQQTNRIKIQETENTKRLIIQCRTDLANKKYELKKFCEENRFRESELIKNHRLYTEQLDELNKIVENLMDDKNVIFQLIPNMDGDSNGLESLLHSLNDINTKLVEISKVIVELKKG